MPRRLLALTVLGVLALAGCTAMPGEEPTPTATPRPTATSTPTPRPTPTPTPTPTADASEYPTVDTISCDTMLEPSVDAALRAKGWVHAAKPLQLSGLEPTLAAIACPWAEPGGTYSEAYYAWAAFAPGERETFIASNEANGYVTEESPEGTWVVWGKDDGMPTPAILVTDEWVAFADTPEDIFDIVWAR